MKKRVLLLSAALLLCVAFVAGAVVMSRESSADSDVVTSLTNLSTANSTATTGNKLTMTDLSVSASDSTVFETSKPSLLYDFSLSDTSNGFQNGHDTLHSEKDGYYSFVITGNDPYLWLSQPNTKCSDAQYVLFYFRTDCKAQGELFIQRSDGVQMGQNGSHKSWAWNATGEWEKQIIYIDSWATSNASINIMRLDPLANGSFVNGETTIDIAYIAFFATEEDANNFNIEEYKKYLAYEEQLKAEEESKRQEEEEANKEVEWSDPTPSELPTFSVDTQAGSVQYAVSADGTEVTISYLLNGETVSYTVPNNVNYVFGGYAGTDDLGRSLYTQYSQYTTTNHKQSTSKPKTVGVYGENGEHYVGIFYFLWMGEHQDTGVWDMTHIVEKYGKDAFNTKTCNAWGPVGQMHYFAEPLYGYYYSSDQWVMRKHMELLSNANVDFLYIDVTNGYEYYNNAIKLMEVCHEMNEQGYDAPQIVFYTHSSSKDVVNRLYNKIYAKNQYPDTWLYVDGKPLIIAEESDNVNDFFTIRLPQWPNENTKNNAWPWMDFTWPQRIFKTNDGEREAISVSMAQHAGTVRFSDSAFYGDRTNRGRSYNGTYDLLTEDSYKLGINFQYQFDRALIQDAKYVLVTGWNEWVAQRQGTNDGSICFIDTSSLEFSRDVEMTITDYYFDNYYMQLIFNVQALKGAAPVIVQDARNPINVTGDFAQWDNVAVTYYDVEGDTVDRNGMAFGKQTMTNTTGRNDIVSSKVTQDTTYLYFYVQCANDISKPVAGTSWMQLFLDVDGNVETGWYGYDYVVNYNANEDFTTSVAKYSGTDGAYGFTDCGTVSYRVKDNQMMIAVPMEMIGVTYYNQLCMQFKWADSDTLLDEMADFYIDGDMAPLGRLNYVYQNYIPGVTTDITPAKVITMAEKAAGEDNYDFGNETTDTEAVTDPETVVTTDTETDPETETETEAEEGCKTIAGGMMMLALIGMCAIALGKKKD
ncbi:MAG: hypothetical protein IJW70_12230 [Clostridia bacterium]|nr:hypothetical protein [Clostridia bacterium]MBQ7380433.1 hypothetical protein [Clostridia bacterium]